MGMVRRLGSPMIQISQACLNRFRNYLTITWAGLNLHYSEDAMGGGKKRGEENLTKDTPPKNGFWTPLRLVRFQTPSSVVALFFSCTEIQDSAYQKLFWRGPTKNSGGCVV